MISLWFWGFSLASFARPGRPQKCLGWLLWHAVIGGSCIFQYLHLTLSASIFSCLRLLHYVFDGVSGCGFLGRGWVWWWRASLAAVANEWLVSFATARLMGHVDCQPFSPCGLRVSMFWVGAARIVAPPWSSLVWRSMRFAGAPDSYVRVKLIHWFSTLRSNT